MEREYREPDWSVPLDVDEWLTRVPGEAQVKGMFIQSALDLARRRSGRTIDDRKFIAFKDYPSRDFIAVVHACATQAFRGEPVRRALFELGREGYLAFTTSMAGRVLFSVAGRDIRAALRLTTRAYELAGTMGSATAEVAMTSAVVQIRNVWHFADTYQVGVFAGGLDAFGKRGALRICPLSLCDVDIEIKWVD